MKQQPIDPTFELQLPQDVSPDEELPWLMSLALDGELTAAEEMRLQSLLTADEQAMDEWQLWQSVDSDLFTEPDMLPSSDFVATFGERLARQERRHRIRTGFVFGAAAVALWCSALVGILMFGAFVWNSQVAILSDSIHQMALWWTAIGHFVETVFNTGGALAAVPQARYAIGGYLVLTVAILSAWFIYLRRSLDLHQLGVQ